MFSDVTNIRILFNKCNCDLLKNLWIFILNYEHFISRNYSGYWLPEVMWNLFDGNKYDSNTTILRDSHKMPCSNGLTRIAWNRQPKLSAWQLAHMPIALLESSGFLAFHSAYLGRSYYSQWKSWAFWCGRCLLNTPTEPEAVTLKVPLIGRFFGQEPQCYCWHWALIIRNIRAYVLKSGRQPILGLFETRCFQNERYIHTPMVWKLITGVPFKTYFCHMDPVT